MMPITSRTSRLSPTISTISLPPSQTSASRSRTSSERIIPSPARGKRRMKVLPHAKRALDLYVARTIAARSRKPG